MNPRSASHFWHPFSNMHDVRDNEVVFVRGRGCKIEDRDGNVYLDATAALWYCNVGYGRREIASGSVNSRGTLVVHLFRRLRERSDARARRPPGRDGTGR